MFDYGFYNSLLGGSALCSVRFAILCDVFSWCCFGVFFLLGCVSSTRDSVRIHYILYITVSSTGHVCPQGNVAL